MPLKKHSFNDDEEPIFDEAVIYKRGEYWQMRMWLAKEGKYALEVCSLKVEQLDLLFDVLQYSVTLLLLSHLKLVSKCFLFGKNFVDTAHSVCSLGVDAVTITAILITIKRVSYLLY